MFTCFISNRMACKSRLQLYDHYHPHHSVSSHQIYYDDDDDDDSHRRRRPNGNQSVSIVRSPIEIDTGTGALRILITGGV